MFTAILSLIMHIDIIFGILSIYSGKMPNFIVTFLNTSIETDELLRYI